MTKKSVERQKAIELGLKTYEGRPCIRCGTTLKYVSQSSCVSCTTQSTKQRDPEIFDRYIKSDKGQTWLKEFRKSKTYNKTQKKWQVKDYAENPEKYHGYSIKRNYGITQEEYKELLEEQQYKCTICGTHQSELSRRLAVDHCHETGKVRGLLCRPCNVSLGLLKENEQIMTNMIEYVRQFKCE